MQSLESNIPTQRIINTNFHFTYSVTPTTIDDFKRIQRFIKNLAVENYHFELRGKYEGDIMRSRNLVLHGGGSIVKYTNIDCISAFRCRSQKLFEHEWHIQPQ